MRIPVLAVVIFVSIALFLWHGFDKYQTLVEFHQQTLSLTAQHGTRAIASGLESLRRRGDDFVPTGTDIATAMKIQFPSAEIFFIGDPADAGLGFFGSADAMRRCDQSPVGPGSIRTALCFSEKNSLILKISRRIDPLPQENMYVRYRPNLLGSFIELLNTEQYRISLNSVIAGSTDSSIAQSDRGGLFAIGAASILKHTRIPNTPWQLVVSVNPELFTAQRNQIVREVLLALAVFLLLAATGTRYFRKIEKRDNVLEQQLPTAIRAHDDLTRLENRRQFESRLDQAILGARAHGNQHALCHIDLDQCKLINDDAEPIARDALLGQIDELLSSKLRARDLLERTGGDFTLLLENCPREKATKIALNIVNAIAGHRFEWHGKIYRSSASIGVAPINSYAENRKQILSQADVACYAAKDLGRNQIYVYHTGSSAPANKHMEIRLAADIRDALEHDRFQLHAQPIVDLQTAAGDTDVSRFEVLLRMYSKDREIIPPNAFIPAAERYNLMVDVDRWVIEKTLKTCAELAPKNVQFEVGVNLSGSSLSDATLLEFVRKQLLKYATDNIRICFEITETTAISNFPNANEFINHMRKMGCSFALDDFGTGLSSFSYLKSFPVDYLKIDGSFIRDIDNDPIDNAMVKSILQISRILDIPVIAEFAEREEIITHLRNMGVNYGQGSALGTPCPIETYLAQSDPEHTALRPEIATTDKSL